MSGRIAELRAEILRHGGPEYALELVAEIDRLRDALASTKATLHQAADSLEALLVAHGSSGVMRCDTCDYARRAARGARKALGEAEIRE